MGSIKKVLAEVPLKDYPSKRLDIEANHGTTGGVDIIHLQTDFWRIELDEAEMKSFAATVVRAAEELRKLKKIPSPVPTGKRDGQTADPVGSLAPASGLIEKSGRPHEPPA